MIKIAGVTFTNPDGESRQDILKSLGIGYHDATVKQTIFENERAVEVWCNDKQVGYIPKINLDDPFIYENRTAVLQICFNEDLGIYHGILSRYDVCEKFSDLIEINEFILQNPDFPTKLLYNKRSYEIVKLAKANEL